jgi:hypothetical protein
MELRTCGVILMTENLIPIAITWAIVERQRNKNNFFNGTDLSGIISKASSNSKFYDKSDENDILNTSAPVKIAEYIGSSLLNYSSVTPKYGQTRTAAQLDPQNDEERAKEKSEMLKGIDTLTSAVKIAQKIHEYNQTSNLSKSKGFKGVNTDCNFVEYPQQFKGKTNSRKAKIESGIANISKIKSNPIKKSKQYNRLCKCLGYI